MNKKLNRAATESKIRRERANETIAFAATNEIKAVLRKFNTSTDGLSEKNVDANRDAYGDNHVTHEKKKTLPQRLAGAFINPFTAILFCLAIVSTITDIILPIMQNSPGDVSPRTVIIIMAMVVISGTLRFVQESRSGSADRKSVV